MEIKKYQDFRENDVHDKLLIMDSGEDGLDGVLDKIEQVVWVVFPRPNYIYPMELTLDPMMMRMTLSPISISNVNKFKLSGNNSISWNDTFDRNVTFDEDGTYHVQGVDKIKMFTKYEDAKEFIECKTDKDFVKKDGNYYVFTIREAQNLIGKTLKVNPRLVVIEQP